MANLRHLILAGETKSTERGTIGFQDTNLNEMVDDVAVYKHQVSEDDKDIFCIVNEAIRTAYEKKGVAVLILPNNLLTRKVKDTTDQKVDTAPPARVAPKPRSIKKAAKLINK